MTRQSETRKLRIRIAVIVALAAVMPAGRSATAEGAPAKPPVKRARFLLLDSRIIESTENAKLTVGVVRKDKSNPLFKEDKPWEPRFDNPYSSVIYDKEEKIYKCWYSMFIKSAYEAAPADKRAQLKCARGAACSACATRLPGMVSSGPSPNWDSTSSTAARRTTSSSSDFLTWSKPELVIEGLDLRMQIHDMPVIRHAGVYIGMVGLFDIKASKQCCELAWSPDSKKWHRIQPGQPLIPNGKTMGDIDWGCIFASAPLIGKDKIRIYYGANDGRFMAWRNGFFCLAWLRADGFAGYEQIAGGSNKTASLTTKPVLAAAGTLCTSADAAPSGYVKVAVLDKDGKELATGELITKTVTDARIKWPEGFSLAKLKGKQIRLRFELRDVKLCSFSFE